MALFFFFNEPATPEIYTLSLHDSLPIGRTGAARARRQPFFGAAPKTTQTFCPPKPKELDSTRSTLASRATLGTTSRSEEHTSELQSRQYLVCRLLLEKKKYINTLSRCRF